MAVTLVTISGSVVDPEGVGIVRGTITCQLSTSGSTLDGAASVRVCGEASGAITAGVLSSLSLVPNDAITPSGTYYLAIIEGNLSNGRRYRKAEKWQLTSSDLTLDIGAVPRLDAVPGVALQQDTAWPEAAAASVAAAAASAAAALVSEGAAQSSAVSAAADEAGAVAAQLAAEMARDASASAGQVYPDEATGRAAVADGAYFYVPAAGADDSLILYRRVNAGTVSTDVKHTASTAAITSRLPSVAPAGYAWALIDSLGNSPLAVRDDGTVVMSVLDSADFIGAVGTTTGKLTETFSVLGYAWSLVDAAGRSAIGVRDSGEVVVGGLDATTATVDAITADTLNGVAVSRIIAGAETGSFGGELVFISGAGQSLGEGSNGTLTTAKEYDNIGFAARASSPAAYVDLTVANTQVTGRGESPLYGTLGHVKELILEENGLAYTDHHFQLLGCCNAYSGNSITALNKGTAPYTATMSQVASLLTIAAAEGRTCRFGAVTWTQGEADAGMTYAAYKAALLQLVNDYDADGKAITGQAEQVILVSYQLSSQPADRHIGLAHLDAALENPTKIFCACPAYQFTYYDYQHIDATSSKWLGAYYGLVVKRVLVDGLAWEPLRPISHRKQGKILNVKFNTPVRPLILDTTGVPAQTSYGFDLLDNVGAAITISSVEVVEPDTVKIVAAATIPSGSTLRYGFGSATGMGSYTGGAGNLRDSQGDTMVYAPLAKPMHNWCVLFTYAV